MEASRHTADQPRYTGQVPMAAASCGADGDHSAMVSSTKVQWPSDNAEIMSDMSSSIISWAAATDSGERAGCTGGAGGASTFGGGGTDGVCVMMTSILRGGGMTSGGFTTGVSIFGGGTADGSVFGGDMTGGETCAMTSSADVGATTTAGAAGGLEITPGLPTATSILGGATGGSMTAGCFVSTTGGGLACAIAGTAAGEAAVQHMMDPAVGFIKIDIENHVPLDRRSNLEPTTHCHGRAGGNDPQSRALCATPPDQVGDR